MDWPTEAPEGVEDFLLSLADHKTGNLYFWREGEWRLVDHEY